MMENYKHTTVLLDEAVNGLNTVLMASTLMGLLVAVVTHV